MENRSRTHRRTQQRYYHYNHCHITLSLCLWYLCETTLVLFKVKPNVDQSVAYLLEGTWIFIQHLVPLFPSLVLLPVKSGAPGALQVNALHPLGPRMGQLIQLMLQNNRRPTAWQESSRCMIAPLPSLSWLMRRYGIRDSILYLKFQKLSSSLIAFHFFIF